MSKRISEARRAKILKMCKSGMKPLQIAKKLGMPPSSVYCVIKTHAFKQPVKPSQAARRTCLKCSRVFKSEGPANRICPRCTKVNDDLIRRSSKLSLEVMLHVNDD